MRKPPFRTSSFRKDNSWRWLWWRWFPRLRRALQPATSHQLSHGCNTNTRIIRSGVHLVGGSEKVRMFGGKLYLFGRAKADVFGGVVHAYERSSVRLFRNARCYLSECATGEAFHRSFICAEDYTQVTFHQRSRGLLYHSCRAKAYGHSRLIAFDSASVQTFGRARLTEDLRTHDEWYRWWAERPVPPHPPRRVELSKGKLRRLYGCY
jgi:hypothetical protein